MGLAVVSEEIRKLAGGYSSAAKEIMQIVNDTIVIAKSSGDLYVMAGDLDKEIKRFKIS